jgi:hypothetical protein
MSNSLPPRVLSVPVGVVVAREKIGHPWQEYTWRPVSVFLNAPELEAPRELCRGPDFVHYHVATVPLELHPKETVGYEANLAGGTPSVYVVLRQSGDGHQPDCVHVHLVTASAYEAQAYGYANDEIIASVNMPEPLIELVREFLAEHHVEEPFYKRQRQKHHSGEEHKFGQEPVHVLRERMRKAGRKDRNNG